MAEEKALMHKDFNPIKNTRLFEIVARNITSAERGFLSGQRTRDAQRNYRGLLRRK